MWCLRDRLTLPNPSCVTYTVSQLGYALLKWLGNRGLLPTLCFPDGWDSPWAAPGKETAETGVSGQNKPRPLPCLPISEAGWWKKCRGKQRQQATKQPGGRSDSANKSSSPYHTVLQEQYFDTSLFISQRKYKEGFHLIVIFSPNTRILRTLITN